MKIKYREQKFSVDRQERILQIDAILAEYENQRVTVRQLYYQLVAANQIANQPNEYNKIQDLVTDARYAGLIDWNAIEDRGREPVRVDDWPSGRGALDEVTNKFRLDRWADQPYYVELWVEKAALAGVLWPIASDYHITLMVNRGSSSASAMKEGANRIIHRSRHGARPSVVLYVGDHDPSGLDMIRDMRNRMAEFGCPSNLNLRAIALTMEQIEQYKLPANPLKVKDNPAKYKVADGSFADSRAAAYAAKFGAMSWEVDALPPKTLDLVCRTNISAYIDKAAMKKVIVRENLIKQSIKKFSLGFREPG